MLCLHAACLSTGMVLAVPVSHLASLVLAGMQSISNLLICMVSQCFQSVDAQTPAAIYLVVSAHMRNLFSLADTGLFVCVIQVEILNRAAQG